MGPPAGSVGSVGPAPSSVVGCGGLVGAVPPGTTGFPVGGLVGLGALVRPPGPGAGGFVGEEAWSLLRLFAAGPSPSPPSGVSRIASAMRSASLGESRRPDDGWTREPRRPPPAEARASDDERMSDALPPLMMIVLVVLGPHFSLLLELLWDVRPFFASGFLRRTLQFAAKPFSPWYVVSLPFRVGPMSRSSRLSGPGETDLLGAVGRVIRPTSLCEIFHAPLSILGTEVGALRIRRAEAIVYEARRGLVRRSRACTILTYARRYIKEDSISWGKSKRGTHLIGEA